MLKLSALVLSMFEPEEAFPGEQSHVRSALGIDEVVELEGVRQRLYVNDEGVASYLVGVGPTEPALRLMALAMSGEVDLSDCWIIIAGIGGVDPVAASLGDAVWVRRVVDGDLAFDIDGREIPSEWPSGIFPIGSVRPGKLPADGGYGFQMSVSLNAELAERCYRASREVALADSPAMAEERSAYACFGEAGMMPGVRMGDALACARFWHGEHHTRWARDWVKLWTENAGHFVVSDMEDMGILRCVEYLGSLGRVNFQKVALVRTASNFCMPPEGKTAVENLVAEEEGRERYPGLEPSLKNLGKVVAAAVGEVHRA